jgi:maleate cis-trans isomerase
LNSNVKNRLRLGFLFPGYSAEDDYPFLGSLVTPEVDVRIVHTDVHVDAHEEQALRETGSTECLLRGAEALREDRVDAPMWACTSGSFVFGLSGATQQALAIQDFLGVPTSSTSLAFIAALKALGIHRVAMAATYPAQVSVMFKSFLLEAGIATDHLGWLGIMTGVAVGAVNKEDVVQLVVKNDSVDAQAVIVPDTALHTAQFIDELERAVDGKPVLTANQVTMWHALRLAKHPNPIVRKGLGTLFRSDW